MALWFWKLDAGNSNGSALNVQTVNFGSPQNIYVSCALSKYAPNGSSPQADFYIASWVQNGQSVTNQHVYALDADGISEVNVELAVFNATAVGLMTATTNK
jgi:hypothetical protein